jgi:hypothetical protein
VVNDAVELYSSVCKPYLKTELVPFAVFNCFPLRFFARCFAFFAVKETAEPQRAQSRRKEAQR